MKPGRVTFKLKLSICLFNMLLLICEANTEERNHIIHKRQMNYKTSLCPINCKCPPKSDGNKVVNCFSAKKKLPIALPADAFSIDLGGNFLRKIDKSLLKNNRYLEKLDISFNPIESIDSGAFQHTGRLRWLDLSFTNLTNLTMANLGEAARSLQVLNISNTHIRAFPKLHNEKGAALTKLKHLDMSNNFFSFVPANHIPSSVEYLDISCMEIKKLPKSFDNLKNLRVLKIVGCRNQKVKLVHISRQALSDLPSLTSLDLSHNDINSIPSLLSNNNLMFLDLSYNRIHRIKSSRCATQDEIGSSFDVFHHSNDDMGTRPINKLGSSLSKLTALKYLNLGGNQIDIICTDDFMYMDQLKILNLTRCKVMKFPPDAFHYAEALRTLDLSHNIMKTFTIMKMPDLEELYVEGNYIREIKRINLETFPRLKRADFSNNLYECDCHLKDFVKFINYSPQENFIDLHSSSLGYTCAGPPKLKGTNLLKLDPNDDLKCGEAESTFPLWAVAAPVSLIGFILLIVALMCLSQVRSGKRSCLCCRRNKHDTGRKKKVVSNFAKYDQDGDIVIQNTINDAAILCHDENNRWVLSSMMPKLQGKFQASKNANDIYSLSDENGRQINIEVFSIGKTIKIDTLHNCIDFNRKVCLVVTHEFLAEKSCLYILQVIEERMSADPKDAVVVVMLDAIPWSDLPSTLQRIMSDKSFVQYPQVDRERQDLYFWDSLCAFIFTTDPHLERRCSSDAETGDIDMHENDHITIASSSRYNVRPVRDAPGEIEFGTIRSSRRARSINDDLPTIPMSSARAARLQRLGIKRNGEIADEVMQEVKEARNIPKQNFHNMALVSNPSLDGNNVTAPSSVRGRTTHLNTDALNSDIDDLYHTRKEPRRNGKSGRVRSLLPPNDDADSIYSDEEEIPIPGYEVRPPERDRPIPKIPRRQRQLQPSICESSRTYGDEDSLNKSSRRSSMTHHDVISNLHGTVELPYANHVSVPGVEGSTRVESPTEAESGKDKKEGKKKSLFGKIKSLL